MSGEKKKAANPDIIFITVELRVIIKSFSFNFSGSNRYLYAGFDVDNARDELLSDMQGRRLIIFHIVCISRGAFVFTNKKACHGFTYISKPVLYARTNNINCGVIAAFVG